MNKRIYTIIFTARRNFKQIKKNQKLDCFGGLVSGIFDGKKNISFLSKWHFKLHKIIYNK